jgi:protein-S-isoprenylcysteine O-methyltransferase Ste14
VSAIRSAIGVLWVVFLVYWLVSAIGAKAGTRARRSRLTHAGAVIVVLIVLSAVNVGDLEVHDLASAVAGALVFASGLTFAVWARVCLGTNWGTPMTEKSEPELVTSGPYRFVRHPIYTGILLAQLGTALSNNLYWLVAVVVFGAYFLHSARVEEKLLTASFPDAYPRYRQRTKMLIPFVL